MFQFPLRHFCLNLSGTNKQAGNPLPCLQSVQSGHSQHLRPELDLFQGLWDTGATNSVITKNVIDRLGLVATGIETVFHAGGQSVVGTYLVNILLPNNIGIHSLRVSEDLLKGVDVLIGMDIIALGDFTICLHDGKTKFSFQLPSTHDFDMTRKE